jgi:hypothetical protein
LPDRYAVRFSGTVDNTSGQQIGRMFSHSVQWDEAIEQAPAFSAFTPAMFGVPPVEAGNEMDQRPRI